MKKLIVSLAVALSLPAWAAPTDSETYAMFGPYDCGQWFAGSTRPNAKTWLLGVLSGQSYMYWAIGNRGDPLKGVQSAQQIFLWMDNWCQAHPLDEVMNGSQMLFVELIKKQKNK